MEPKPRQPLPEEPKRHVVPVWLNVIFVVVSSVVAIQIALRKGLAAGWLVLFVEFTLFWGAVRLKRIFRR